MMQNSIVKIGLTGGIGSGKSTVTNMLIERGVSVVDCDKISREILEIYQEIKCKIKENFGKDFFDKDNNLLRRKLGDYIFEDELRKNKLEEITLPYIKDEIFKSINKLEGEGKNICIVDAPTLIESGFNEYMDYSILVWTDVETQIERVRNRDNMKKDQVLKRINSQMTLDSKINYVDYVLDNSGSIHNTKIEANKIIDDILIRTGNAEVLP